MQQPYDLSLPDYCSFDKEAGFWNSAWNVAKGGFGVAAELTGIPSAYRIATQDLPGMAKNLWRGDYRAALGNLGNGAINALGVLPGIGAAAKGTMIGARTAGKVLGYANNLAKSTKALAPVASTVGKGITTVRNSAVGARAAQAGAKIQQGAKAVTKVAPKWTVDPSGMGLAKNLGATTGLAVGAGLINPAGMQQAVTEGAQQVAQRPGVGRQLVDQFTGPQPRQFATW